VFAVLVGLLGQVVGCNDDPWEGVQGPLAPVDLVQSAVQAMDAGEVARSEALLARAMQLAPHDPAALFTRCSLRYHQHRFDVAEALCTEAIAQSEPEPPYMMVLERGLVRVKRGDLDGAEQDFQRCRQMDPDNAEAWYDESWVWAARGDVERTIELIQAAGERDPVYAGREFVGTDPPYRAFGGDPRWEAFLEQLKEDAPERRESALTDEHGVEGVPGAGRGQD